MEKSLNNQEIKEINMDQNSQEKVKEANKDKSAIINSNMTNNNNDNNDIADNTNSSTNGNNKQSDQTKAQSSIDTLDKLLAAYNVNPDDIFNDGLLELTPISKSGRKALNMLKLLYQTINYEKVKEWYHAKNIKNTPLDETKTIDELNCVLLPNHFFNENEIGGNTTNNDIYIDIKTEQFLVHKRLQEALQRIAKYRSFILPYLDIAQYVVNQSPELDIACSFHDTFNEGEKIIVAVYHLDGTKRSKKFLYMDNKGIEVDRNKLYKSIDRFITKQSEDYIGAKEQVDKNHLTGDILAYAVAMLVSKNKSYMTENYIVKVLRGLALPRDFESKYHPTKFDGMFNLIDEYDIRNTVINLANDGLIKEVSKHNDYQWYTAYQANGYTKLFLDSCSNVDKGRGSLGFIKKIEEKLESDSEPNISETLANLEYLIKHPEVFCAFPGQVQAYLLKTHTDEITQLLKLYHKLETDRSKRKYLKSLLDTIKQVPTK